MLEPHRTLVFTAMLSASCAAAEPRGEPEAGPPTIAPDASSTQPVVTATAVASATASASVAPLSQRETVELRAAARVLEIAFKPGPLGFVSTIKEGDVALSLPRLKSRDAVGRGDDLLFIDHVARDGRAYALFAATTHGSPECGSYGFWALLLDAKGVRVTPMIEGCFLSVGGGHPKITWSKPPLLVVESPQYQSGASIEVFTLDEATFVFRSRVQAKVPD